MAGDVEPVGSRQQRHQLLIIGKSALANLDARDAFIVEFLNLRFQFGGIRRCRHVQPHPGLVRGRRRAKLAAFSIVTGLKRTQSALVVATTFAVCPSAATGRRKSAVETALSILVVLIVVVVPGVIGAFG